MKGRGIEMDEYKILWFKLKRNLLDDMNNATLSAVGKGQVLRLMVEMECDTFLKTNASQEEKVPTEPKPPKLQSDPSPWKKVRHAIKNLVKRQQG